MNAKQTRLYKQLRRHFDATTADRLRRSLRDSGGTETIAEIDEMERQHGVHESQVINVESTRPPQIGMTIYIRGYECRVARIEGHHFIDIEDGLRKPEGQCDWPQPVYEVLVVPTGYTRTRPREVNSTIEREMDRATEIARLAEGGFDA